MTTPSRFKASELSKSGKKENKPVLLAPSLLKKTPNGGGSSGAAKKTAIGGTSSIKTKENQYPISNTGGSGYKHLSTHVKVDSITPVNNSRHLKSLLDSSNKAVYGSSSVQKSTRFMHKEVTTHHSAVSRNILSSANKASSSSIKTTTTSTTPYFESRFGVNPVVNGVDYTNIMMRKHELGYIGPGYIVEFSCNPEFLRGILIEKGLHRVTKIVDPSNGMIPGAQKLFTERIDQEDFRKTGTSRQTVPKTPLKSLIPKIDFPTRNFNHQTPHVVDPLPVLDDSVAYYNDECVTDVIEEEKPVTTAANTKSGHSVRFLLSPALNSTHTQEEEEEKEAEMAEFLKMKKPFQSKHRRSASCSDLPKFIISEPGDDDDEDDVKSNIHANHSYMNILTDHTSCLAINDNKTMNETYDKSLNSPSYQQAPQAPSSSITLNINLMNMTNDTSGLTLPGLQRPHVMISNSSFLDGHHHQISLSRDSSSSSLLSSTVATATISTTSNAVSSPLFAHNRPQDSSLLEQRLLRLFVDSVSNKNANPLVSTLELTSEQDRQTAMHILLKFEQTMANIKQSIAGGGGSQ